MTFVEIESVAKLAHQIAELRCVEVRRCTTSEVELLNRATTIE